MIFRVRSRFRPPEQHQTVSVDGDDGFLVKVMNVFDQVLFYRHF